MNSVGSCVDIPLVSDIAYDVLAYQRYIEQGGSQASSDAYLFYEPRVRFEVEADDVLKAIRPLDVQRLDTGCRISHRNSGFVLAVPQLDAATAERIIAALAIDRTVLGVEIAAQLRGSELDDFLSATFGKVVFAPQALERLESRISGTELVRFVRSPYELQRNYWSNMADCREAILADLFGARDLETWLLELRKLHFTALLGRDRRSFYRPQSPLGRRDPRPGAFYSTSTRTVQQGDLTLFIDGPRVSAPPVGGSLYHQLLCESVGDAAAMSPRRQLSDASGLDWGTVTLGLARGDTAAAAWFCPPRPPSLEHFKRLHSAFLQSIANLERSEGQWNTEPLADLHWQFVRLHPFRCANQSLSMNIVNAILAHASCSTIPHLLLDQCALRLTRLAYQRVFARVTRYWASTGSNSLERWTMLAEKRATLDRFVSQITECENVAAARSHSERSGDAARLALLVD